jgi:hypothetical protein
MPALKGRYDNRQNDALHYRALRGMMVYYERTKNH